MNTLAIKYNVSIGTLVREVMIELHAERGSDSTSGELTAIMPLQRPVNHEDDYVICWCAKLNGMTKEVPCSE